MVAAGVANSHRGQRKATAALLDTAKLKYRSYCDDASEDTDLIKVRKKILNFTLLYRSALCRAHLWGTPWCGASFMHCARCTFRLAKRGYHVKERKQTR